MPERSPQLADILEALHPDPHILLDLLRLRVDDGMLRQIAEADCGFGAEANLAVLKRVRDQGAIPSPLEWEPKEVLHLTRWSEPEAIDSKSHLVRAFACAILLRAAAEPELYKYFEDEGDTLAQLVESALALGPHATDATVGFAAWSASRAQEEYHHTVPLLVAILLLSLARPPTFALQQTLMQVVGWIVGEASRIQEPGLDETGAWLMLTAPFNGLKREKWQLLARRMLPGIAPASDPLALRLAEIRAHLLDD